MTATDELRRLLDEHGVEHQDYEFSPGVKTTSWDIDTSNPRYEVCAAFEEFDGGTTLLRFWNPTPEQAVEATLGRGTCGEWRNECTYYDPTGVDADLWCEHCDEPLEVDWGFCPHCGRRVAPDCGRKVVCE